MLASHAWFLAAGTGTQLLDDLALLVIGAVAMSVLLHKLRLPTITGLLLTGAVVGPFGLGLLGEQAETVSILAEIGLILLLFTIGLEFSLKRLVRMWRIVIIGGALQVGLTGVVTAGIAVAFGVSFELAVLLGCLISLSSTAIVLRGLTERNELDVPHGRFIVGVLIFQDLCVVPMLLLVPLLAGQTEGAWYVVLPLIGLKTALVVAGVLVLARMIVPRIFRWVDATRSREVFLLAVLGVCIGTAWATARLDLSVALGAFLAGVVLADTDFGNRAIGDILPLKDLLASVFFVSLGMLFDVQVLRDFPFTVAAILLAVIVGKALFAILAAHLLRFPARVTWLAGIGLAQMGEFGFVLTRTAEDVGFAATDTLAPVLAAGVISMFLAPLMMRLAPHVRAGERILRPLEKLLGARGVSQISDAQETRENHVIVVGYGPGGRLLGRALAAAGQPYMVLELNAETVRKARQEGEHIYYGDITSGEALHHVRIDKALALVLMINDREACRRAIVAARHVAPSLPILVRARYLSNVNEWLELGATDVAVEELEGSAELLAKVLRRVGLSGDRIQDALLCAREATLPTERPSNAETVHIGHWQMRGLRAESVALPAGAKAVGQSLADLRLRSDMRVNVVAIRRDETLDQHPDPTTPLHAGDELILMGQPRDLTLALERLRERAAEDDVTASTPTE